MQLQDLKSLPAKGTSIDRFLEMQVRKKTRRTLSLNGGHEMLDDEISDIAQSIFKKVAA